MITRLCSVLSPLTPTWLCLLGCNAMAWVLLLPVLDGCFLLCTCICMCTNVLLWKKSQLKPYAYCGVIQLTNKPFIVQLSKQLVGYSY